MNWSLLIHEVLCAALFYSIFCRAVHTDDRVKLDVRFSFFVMGAASLMSAVAPIAWGHEPRVYDLLLLGSVVLVQLVASQHWRKGVPEQFIRPEFRPRNRRQSDREVNT